jgi:hypothetical protein
MAKFYLLRRARQGIKINHLSLKKFKNRKITT